MKKEIKDWFYSGSNVIDLLILIGIIIIISTTFYINKIIGFYLLGGLLIFIPGAFYLMTSKR